MPEIALFPVIKKARMKQYEMRQVVMQEEKYMKFDGLITSKTQKRERKKLFIIIITIITC